jgi:hypothetical protein
MFKITCKFVLPAFIFVLIWAAAPQLKVRAQENTICGLLLRDTWNASLALSPTKAVGLRPIDLDDIQALNSMSTETYIRIYDPDYTSGDPLRGVIQGFSRIEKVTSCFDPLPTFTPLPLTTSYGCENSAEQPPQCGCGVYVPLQTFGGTISSHLGQGYANAASEAVQIYWNEGYLQHPEHGAWRYQVDFARTDDALIFQPGAPFFLIQPNGQLSSKQFALANYGHTGIVRSASRISKSINQALIYGWEIVLRSANWGCNNQNKTFIDGACQNISDIRIFIPEGSAVSFWRKVSNPQFVTMYSASEKMVLKPINDGAGSAILANIETSNQITKQYTITDYYQQLSQSWALVKLPQVDPYLQTQYYQIVNMATGKCLDISAGGKDNGTSVLQWYCHNGDNQKWQLIPTYNNYQIKSVSSGKYLTYLGKQSPSLVIWDAQNTASQTWEMHRLTPGCALKTHGDANCDGKTDISDIGIWGRTYCIPTSGVPCTDLSADFDFDGDVDDADNALMMKYYQ